jgi:hypothetical protein
MKLTKIHDHFQTIALLSIRFLIKYNWTRAELIITISSKPVKPRSLLSWANWFSKNPHSYLYVCSLIFYPLSTYSSIAFSFFKGSRKCWSWATDYLVTISANFSISITTKTGSDFLLTNLKYLRSELKLTWKVL